MLYKIDQPQAEDDGSAWSFQPSGAGFARVQTRPLSILSLRDGLRALGVGGEMVVDAALAAELGQAVPGLGAVTQPVTVRGPQPALLRLPNMVQLGALATVRLARQCIERDAQGKITRLAAPFVLNTATRTQALTIAEIEENQITVVSEAVRDLLLARQPDLLFSAVRFEDEAPPIEAPAPPFRMPTREELLKLERGS